ncbi:MAG TPA: FAD-dependent oxidoreductase [Solirubrobacteraceae bacterium]|jgi:monoamine oxidase|nr:FAD-dependent oxidoreductase [Solirubrobacteraceae bacterium]
MSAPDVTRRRFVAGALAGGAAAALPTAARAAKPGAQDAAAQPPRAVDVVVVGGGFAGLSAARAIAHAGRSVIVLEARDRVGGRVWNHPIGGGHVAERGGTFAGPTQDHVLALARAVHVDTFPTYDTGKDLYVTDATRLAYSDSGPFGTAPPDPSISGEIIQVVAGLDGMSGSVPVARPWTAAHAAAWDAQTLADWLRSQAVSPAMEALTAAATRPIFGAEPREVSLLFSLFYTAAAGDAKHAGTFQRLFDTRQGAQMWRFVGGSQEIAIKVAAALGDRLVLDAPVRRIAQSGGHVSVGSDRFTIRAKRVIVAIAPTLAGRIDYAPHLPAARDRLTQQFPQGTLIKVAAVYAKPFWRHAGLNGTVTATNGPVSIAYDDSPPGGKPGVLFGFVGGDNARAHQRLSPSARRAAVVKQFVSFFGPAAAHPSQYFETDWSEQQWTRGCPVGIPGPGVLHAYGPSLREPVGHIHWAGTETATFWNGYMDGAISSGQRAASEVLSGL